MNGDALALGAAALLAMASMAGRGSANVEKKIERPKFLFDLYDKRHQQSLIDAARSYTSQKQTYDELFPVPDVMLRRNALRSHLRRVGGDAGATEEHVSNFFTNAMLDYVIAGRNNFVVGPELQQMLLHTSLNQVKRWMIKPPYSTFYIALPESELAIWGTEPSLEKVRGLMVDFDFMTNTMGVLLWAPVSNLPAAIDRIQAGASRIPREELERLFGWLGNDSYVLIDLDEAFDYDKGLEAYIRDKFSAAAPSFGWPSVMVEKTQEARIEAMKLAIGTIMYLQSDKANLSVDSIVAAAVEKRKELRKAIKRTNKPKRIRNLKKEIERVNRLIPSGGITTWLGKNIEASAKAPEGTGRTIGRRFWVRGHWKVPYAKHKQREITWIAPYEKGKNKPTQITTRTYRFDVDDT